MMVSGIQRRVCERETGGKKEKEDRRGVRGEEDRERRRGGGTGREKGIDGQEGKETGQRWGGRRDREEEMGREGNVESVKEIKWKRKGGAFSLTNHSLKLSHSLFIFSGCCS